MKNIHAAFSLTTTLAVVAAVLCAGCGQGSGGGSSTSSSTTSPNAAAPVVSAEKNSFKEVTAHLDPGGNLYVYLSTEQWLTGLSDKITSYRSMIQSMPAGNPDDQERLGKVVDLIGNVVKDSGVEQVSGVGLSTIEWEPGMYRTTSVLHHYPGNDSGYLWSVGGKQPHALSGLDLLPDNTALATFADLDVPLIWSAVQKEATKSDIPEVSARIQDAPDYFTSVTGLKLPEVLDSLGGEYGLVLTLDDTHPVAIPISGRTLQMPEPALVMIFKVKNDIIYDAVKAKMTANPQIVEVESDGIKMCTMPIPLPLPISVRPTIARSGDYLFLGSSEAIIKSLVAVKAGTKPGLKSTDEFKKLARNIPEQGNSFSFVSQKLGQLLQDFQTQTMQASAGAGAGGSGGPQAAIMGKMMRSLSGPPVTSYAVGANGDDGFVSVANGNHDPSRAVMLVPVAIAGVAAGVAVPAFVSARQAAQRASARRTNAPAGN